MLVNSLIIFSGAILGTWLVHFVTERGAELLSILTLAVSGAVLSILLNRWIIRSALQPLLTLRTLANSLPDQIAEGFPGLETSLHNPDADTRQLAAALTGLVERLSESNHQLRLLSGRAIQAQEEERNRIARSLHDDTAQALLTLMLNLERLEGRLPASETEIRQQLVQARELAASTLNELRQIIAGLRPAILDDLGLVPAIRWFARTRLEEAGVQLEFQAPEAELPLTPELRIALFRIAQEAVSNIVRHARAKSAKINLMCVGPELVLQVEDDGRGFTLSQDQGEAIQRAQWGLVGIQERVSLVGGKATLLSTPGRGTRLEITVPLSACLELEHG